MADKNGYRRARTGRGTEALAQRKADVEARKAAEHIYSNLNTFTLGGDEAASAANVSTMTNAIHIQDSNEEALITANIINDALFRSDGGPIPGTGEVKASAVVPDNTRTIVDFGGVNGAPRQGEVWELTALNAIRTSLSSSSYVYIYINDEVNSRLMQVFAGTSASATFMLQDDGSMPENNLTLDENCTLQFVMEGAANWTNAYLYVYCKRVR